MNNTAGSRGALVAPLVLLTLFAASCGSAKPTSTASATAQGPTGSTASAPSTSTSTSTTPRLAAGSHSVTIQSGGRIRTLILYVPAAMPAAPAPLVLVYHGALDTAAETQAGTDFDPTADTARSYVAYLQGYQDTWNEGAGHTPAEQAGVDDVQFTADALVSIERLVPVATSQVAATGFSNGALLADYLGCRLAQSLALIVTVAGPLPVSVSADCAPTRPISVLAIHGTADPTIPYDGGPFAGVGGGTTVLSAAASVARWAALDGCTTRSQTDGPDAQTRLSVYGNCRNGAKVTLRTLVGAGHNWPDNIGDLVEQALHQS